MKPTVVSLLLENARLRDRVRLLEEQVNFLGQHKTLSSGIVGERLIARLTGGSMTGHGELHDVLAGSDLIEVKFAKLSRPNKHAATLRWQWQKIFGQANSKNYTHLLLIGEADPRFQDLYLEPESPFVLFLIPSEQVLPLCSKGNPLGIVLNSNPQTARGACAALFDRWQAKAATIEQRYEVATGS